MKRPPLRGSLCGELTFVSKGLLMLLDDLMSNVVLLRSILMIRISSSRRNGSRISIDFVRLMVIDVISIPVIMISSWNFWTLAARDLWHNTMCFCHYHNHFGSSRDIPRLYVEFWFIHYLRWLSMTGRRILVGLFGLPGFCKRVSNSWLTLTYSCFVKMLVDSAIRSWNSVGTYFRNSGDIWSYPGVLLFRSLWMVLVTSSLVMGVLRGLELPMNISSFDSFWSLKCALTWFLMML